MEATTKEMDVFRKAVTVLSMMILPALCFGQSRDSIPGRHDQKQTQQADSIMRQKLMTTSPRLGGVTVTNTVISIKADGQTFTVQLPTVEIGIPVYKNFKTPHPILLKASIRYQALILSDEGKIRSNNFHSISIPLIFSYSFSRATNLTLIGSPSINSDYKRDLTADDLQYTAGVRIGIHQNRKFKYGIAATYVKGYSGTYLLPVIDIDWTINKRLSLTAILPARTTLKYKLSEKHALGATLWINGSMYRLNDEAEKEQYIHLRQTCAGLLYEAKLGQRWKLNLVAGYTLVQKLETFDIDQKIALNKFADLNRRTANVSYIEKSFVVQGGVSYQF